MNNSWALFIGAVVLVAILSVCVGGRSKEMQIGEGAKAGDLNLSPCIVKLNSGKYDADCGILIVPENRNDPDSRLIALPVKRIHATGANPAEPIFYLEGGPGMSNMHAQPPAGLLADHDFIMVGYRGVDGSVKLDCPEVNEAIKGDGVDLLSDQSRAGMTEALRQCSERLQREGVDLNGYTIAEVVTDMEAARMALGYERINLMSASYGTRVAQVYAYQFPERIHRSAMIGVNPPGRFVWEAVMIDQQIEYYSSQYAKSANPRVENLAESMRSVSHNMPQHWLFFRIDPGKVKSVTFAMLFHRNTSAMVFDAYIAAANGDPSGLALMSLAYDFIIPTMSVYGEFFSKGGSADFDSSRDYFAELNPKDSIIGSPLAALIWGSVAVDGKPVWATELMPQELREIQPSDVETILISGNVDFSTPADYATDDLLPSLSNGKQVVLREFGHVNDVMTLQPKAIERLLVSFYDTGVVDDLLFTYAPMNFEVKAGFPFVAKALVGLVLPLLGLLVWLAIRCLRSSRKSG